jgi:hypothetical protein
MQKIIFTLLFVEILSFSASSSSFKEREIQGLLFTPVPGSVLEEVGGFSVELSEYKFDTFIGNFDSILADSRLIP